MTLHFVCIKKGEKRALSWLYKENGYRVHDSQSCLDWGYAGR